MELNAGTTTLPEWLGRRAQLSPGGPALITDEGRWTFAELDALAQEVAERLARLGVRAGDRVALLLGNSPSFVVWVHALPRVGAVLVPLNTRLTPGELAWQLADVGAALLVHDAVHADKALAVVQELPGMARVRLPADDEPARMVVDRPMGPLSRAPDGSAAQKPVSLRDWVDLGAVHSIIYTSGTTGRPKGAMLTYGNHWWSATASCLNLGLVPGDCWLACLPLFHVGGLSILLRSVIYGIPVVLHRRFDAAAANRAIDRQGVTIVSVVAAMLARMLDERGAARYPDHLRAVLLGGGPAPLPLLQRAAAAGVPVLQTYGLTEAASQVATLAPEDALRKLGSAGKPLFPTRVRVVRDGRPLPASEVGEITVSGPTVTPGYWNRPDATAAALTGGWLHTGDMGYLDPDGYLYVVDRREDLIISGGENVYPAEVEAVLLSHPAVAEAAVVGAPDERWGQVPAAYVVLRQGQRCSAEELVAFCRERLAGYKVPARVTFLTELPKGSSGKTLRRALREPGAQPGGEL